MREKSVFLENGIQLPFVGRERSDIFSVKDDLSLIRCFKAADQTERGSLSTACLLYTSILNVPLSLIVLFFLSCMFAFIKYNSKRSKRYFNEQQAAMGELNGFVEEMVSGQKVEKVFNHEAVNFETFCEKNEKQMCIRDRCGTADVCF